MIILIDVLTSAFAIVFGIKATLSLLDSDKIEPFLLAVAAMLSIFKLSLMMMTQSELLPLITFNGIGVIISTIVLLVVSKARAQHVSCIPLLVFLFGLSGLLVNYLNL